MRVDRDHVLGVIGINHRWVHQPHTKQPSLCVETGVNRNALDLIDRHRVMGDMRRIDNIHTRRVGGLKAVESHGTIRHLDRFHIITCRHPLITGDQRHHISVLDFELLIWDKIDVLIGWFLRIRHAPHETIIDQWIPHVV